MARIQPPHMSSAQPSRGYCIQLKVGVAGCLPLLPFLCSLSVQLLQIPCRILETGRRHHPQFVCPLQTLKSMGQCFPKNSPLLRCPRVGIRLVGGWFLFIAGTPVSRGTHLGAHFTWLGRKVVEAHCALLPPGYPCFQSSSYID